MTSKPTPKDTFVTRITNFETGAGAREPGSQTSITNPGAHEGDEQPTPIEPIDSPAPQPKAAPSRAASPPNPRLTPPGATVVQSQPYIHPANRAYVDENPQESAPQGGGAIRIEPKGKRRRKQKFDDSPVGVFPLVALAGLMVFAAGFGLWFYLRAHRHHASTMASSAVEAEAPKAVAPQHAQTTSDALRSFDQAFLSTQQQAR